MLNRNDFWEIWDLILALFLSHIGLDAENRMNQIVRIDLGGK